MFDAPADLICPISHELYSDPVLNSAGQVHPPSFPSLIVMVCSCLLGCRINVCGRFELLPSVISHWAQKQAV